MKRIPKICLTFVLTLMLIIGSGTVFAKTYEQNTFEISAEAIIPILCATDDVPALDTYVDVPDGETILGEPTGGTPNEGESREEPSAQEPPAQEPDTDNQPTEEPPTVEQSVNVRRLMPDIIRDGDPFWIEATLSGFDGISYELQWQFDDGESWKDMPNAKDTKVMLIANRANVNYRWRVLVTMNLMFE